MLFLGIRYSELISAIPLFVAVGDYSELVSATPWYSSLWASIWANLRYSLVFVAVGDHSELIGAIP